MSAIFHTWCGLSANFNRPEACCTQLPGNAGHKSRQISPSGHHGTTLSCHISSKLRHVSTIEKISSRCPHNMVNFGPQAAEIGPVVWGTPANFNGFRVLSALLNGSQVVGVSQTAALNTGHHLCSAGRPSRSALAHILVSALSLKERSGDTAVSYIYYG